MFTNSCRASVKAISQTTSKDTSTVQVCGLHRKKCKLDLLSITNKVLVVVLDFAFTVALQELYALSLLCT